MKKTFLYPGSFCPPTRGHVMILRKAAKIFPRVAVVCSTNPDKKTAWFNEEECRDMWLSYHLPRNIEVETFASVNGRKNSLGEIIMIRGIRNRSDYNAEKSVMFRNYQDFGIDKYFYIFGGKEFCDISSTKAREAAEALDFPRLAKYVSPRVVSRLLEKALGIRNLILVVGRPGSGKSSLLQKLSQEDHEIEHINSDDFSAVLEPLVKGAFPNKDLVQMALENEEKIKKLVGRQWKELLSQRLREASGRKTVLVEIPFAMQADKLLFRWIGAKVIYIGCGRKESRRRVRERGTPQHLPFVEKIPGRKETLWLAKKHKLKVVCVETDGKFELSLKSTKQAISQFA